MSRKKLDYMICDMCNLNFKDEDFLNRSKICYKCVYKKKLTESNKNKKRDYFCKVCNSKIIRIEDLKQNQRTVYCSKKCARVGFNESRHWTKKLREAVPCNF